MIKTEHYSCCNVLDADCSTCPKRPLAWEHLWDAPDGTFKGRCKDCGFVHVFIEGHDCKYRFCPVCGSMK